jgi:hypothetical protein
MHLRRNTECSIFNSLFCGYPHGLYIDGSAAQTNATNDVLRIENTFLAGMVSNYFAAFDNTYFTNGARNNQTFTNNTDLQIADPFNLTAPNFLPTKNVYFLNGWVYIDTLVTLTIQPGTIIRGDKGNKGAIIVERGGKLIANGNVNEPIVFTSNQPVGSRNYGDWGGIILCGRATINPAGGIATIEGGVGTQYGGGSNPDDADNSGSLKYVRIEFPGVAFQPNNEINGLTMGGVGNGTTLDYVQVSFSGDDAFEWFGGKVNAKHLIALRNWDDDFDTDFGYQGKVQFAVSLRDPAVADVSKSNGFESDNDGSGSNNLPLTWPTFSNVSIFGPKVTPTTTSNALYQAAMHLRRNTTTSVFNSLFEGYPIGLFLDGAKTQNKATTDSLKIENTFFSGMVQNFNAAFDSVYFTSPARSNTKFSANSSITDPFNLTNPNFLPMTGSPVLFGSRWVKTINGKIEYDNAAGSDMNNVTVICRDNNGRFISSATTNATGDYSLSATDGVFNLSVDCQKAWGGVTVSDVIKIRQVLALIPGVTFTATQAIAADVNLSNNVSVTDVIAIRQRLALIPAPNWIAPNYVFETATVSIAPAAGVTTKNIRGLCSGDANSSFTPPVE